MFTKCQKCGKKLTDPDSMERGYGPECWSTITGIVVNECKEADNAPFPGQMDIFMFPEFLPANGKKDEDGR